MTTDELIELAYMGHASSRDAIRYAIEQEREMCAKACEEQTAAWTEAEFNAVCMVCADAVRSRK